MGTRLKPGCLGLAPVASSFSLSSLFLVLLKIGVVVFGSGCVLLAFLRADFVVHRNGSVQFSRLPHSFGFLLGGTRGAIVATIVILLPCAYSSSTERTARAAYTKTKSCWGFTGFLDDYPLGSTMLTSVPWLSDRISSRPPNSFTRSRIPERPTPVSPPDV